MVPMKKRPPVILCFLFVIGGLLVSCAARHQVRILHVNDFHGFAIGYKPYGSDETLGGLPYLAGSADRLRAEKPTMLLAAGDMIQGNNWTNLFQGTSTIEAMNAMGFDAMVVGNHEFDFGQGALMERIKQATFPVLGANVVGLSGLKPYMVKELDGVKIAVIGVFTAEAPVSTHPRNVVGLAFLPPLDTVERYVRELRDKNDLIIVLSHQGLGADIELAKKVAGVDVIVGGHTHTKLTRPIQVGNTVIVQAFEHGKALGVLDLVVRNGKIVTAENRLEPVGPKTGWDNKAVAALVGKYRQRVDALMEEVIGEAETDLDGKYVRLRETNLGNLIADILRRTTGADAALINGGGIRMSVLRGPVKVSDIYAVTPFDNYIVAIRLTGRQIRDALEHGVSGVEDEEGRFPQVSGLAFTYNLSGPRGSRVREILIGGRPLVDDREYTVATNDFLAAGGDGYKAFGDAIRSSQDYAVFGGAVQGEKLVYNDAGRWLRDVVIDFVKATKHLTPVVEGRIREVGY